MIVASTFPAARKITNVTPVFKKGSKLPKKILDS